MPEPGSRGAVRRIVTAVPAAAEVAPLLRLAARMAGELDAQVAAVLVHNEALTRLANLSATRHLLAATGVAEPLTAQTLRLAMSASSRRLRESLDSIFGAAHVRWTLHTLADENEETLPVALQAEDLLLISAEARIVEAWFRAEPSPEPAVAAFAIRDHGDMGHDVVAVHDGTEAGWRALEAAMLMARAQNGCCHVVIPEPVSAETRQRVAAALAEAALPCQSMTAATANLSSLMPAIQASGAGIVVLPANVLRQPGLASALRQLAGGSGHGR